jgi:2-oxoisovalerate dehydrogenase E1 component alpha subunit
VEPAACSIPRPLRRGLRAMILTRPSTTGCIRAHRQGKTSFYMKCTGEEAIAVAQSMILDREDMGFPTYRQQGLADRARLSADRR